MYAKQVGLGRDPYMSRKLNYINILMRDKIDTPSGLRTWYHYTKKPGLEELLEQTVDGFHSYYIRCASRRTH
jgi:hypothetical protein